MSPLAWNVISRRGKDICLVCSQIYSKPLEQRLTHRRHLVYLLNERVNIQIHIWICYVNIHKSTRIYVLVEPYPSIKSGNIHPFGNMHCGIIWIQVCVCVNVCLYIHTKNHRHWLWVCVCMCMHVHWKYLLLLSVLSKIHTRVWKELDLSHSLGLQLREPIITIHRKVSSGW